MSDDKSKRGPADRSRVNVHEDYELQYWSEKFGVSKQKIRDAVAAVGPMVHNVEAWLKQNR